MKLKCLAGISKDTSLWDHSLEDSVGSRIFNDLSVGWSKGFSDGIGWCEIAVQVQDKPIIVAAENGTKAFWHYNLEPVKNFDERYSMTKKTK